MPNVLVGRKAPDFRAAAVLSNGEMMNFHFSEATKNKYALLFFYPLDFTFVCPTELVALDRALDEFKKREVEVIGISIDSQFSHHAWRNAPIEKGGIGPVGYPLVADVTHAIAQSYGIEHPEAGVALRAAFLVDKSGVVRAQLVNDLPLGRSIDEIIRLIDALQYHEVHGEVCPVNWQKGKPSMKATPQGAQAYFESHAGKV